MSRIYRMVQQGQPASRFTPNLLTLAMLLGVPSLRRKPLKPSCLPSASPAKTAPVIGLTAPKSVASNLLLSWIRRPLFQCSTMPCSTISKHGS